MLDCDVEVEDIDKLMDYVDGVLTNKDKSVYIYIITYDFFIFKQYTI